MQFDFVGRTLTLARNTLIPAASDAIPLVDLRPLGAPVASYAVRVDKLRANGEELPLRRPVVAVIDTGTTGLVLSDSLYDSDEFPLPVARQSWIERAAFCAKRVGSNALLHARRPCVGGLGLEASASARSPCRAMSTFRAQCLPRHASTCRALTYAARSCSP